MNHETAPLSDAALVQRALWGTNALDWADLAEPHQRPLFEAVLAATGVGRGTRLLDLGCGSGLALRLAADRGAEVSGIDVSPELLAIARERLPHADLRDGDLQVLPFDDTSFDVVVGFNSVQFAADPIEALREAGRVLRAGGVVAVSTFAEPERNESTPIHEAMSTLIPPAAEADHAPYALSAPGGIERALTEAGLEVVSGAEVGCVWHYDDLESAVRGLLCSGGGARAVAAAGEPRVREVLESSLGAIRNPATGGVTMRNVFRYVIGRRADAAS